MKYQLIIMAFTIAMIASLGGAMVSFDKHDIVNAILYLVGAAGFQFSFGLWCMMGAVEQAAVRRELE